MPRLIEAGATVQAYDPEGMQAAEPMLPGVVWKTGAYEALQGADAMVLLTEWSEFRGLDPARIAAAMTGKAVIDLRNVYRPEEMRRAGFNYHSIGRPESPLG